MLGRWEDVRPAIPARDILTSQHPNFLTRKKTRSKEPRPDCVTQGMRLIAASFRT